MKILVPTVNEKYVTRISEIQMLYKTMSSCGVGFESCVLALISPCVYPFFFRSVF